MGGSRRHPGRTGRPTLLTPELQRRLLDLVRAGVPISKVGPAAGVSDRTVFNWLAAGRDAQLALDAALAGAEAAGGRAARRATARLIEDGKDTPYLHFFQEFTRARAEFGARTVVNVAKAAAGGFVIKERTRTYYDHGKQVTEVEKEFAPPNVQASKFLLERSFPEDWGPRPTVASLRLFTGPAEEEPGDDLAASLDEHVVTALSARLATVYERQKHELGAAATGQDDEDGDAEDAVIVG